jgi:peroxiredoxin
MTVNVGDLAPDFELVDTAKEPVRLSTYRGTKDVVVLFLPGAFTRTCTGELCALRDDLSEYQNEGTELLVISVDQPASQKRWAEEQGFTFPILSDFWPHGAVAESYGVLDGEKGTALRGTFIVDRQGVVRWKVVNGSRDPREPAEYKEVLRTLGQAG